MTLSDVFGALLEFAFFYPFFMAYLWMTGAVYYFFDREKVEKRAVDDPPPLRETPGVTFIVPCHDEGPNARETIGALFEQVYPDFEVIAINDASNDETGQILNEMALLDEIDLRQSPPSPIDGRPQKRANLAEVESLAQGL